MFLKALNLNDLESSSCLLLFQSANHVNFIHFLDNGDRSDFNESDFPTKTLHKINYNITNESQGHFMNSNEFCTIYVNLFEFYTIYGNKVIALFVI